MTAPRRRATAVLHTPSPEAPFPDNEPEAHESNPVVLVIAALCMPVVAGWRLLAAAGRGLRALGRRLAGWADSLLRWLGRGIVVVGRAIGRGLRTVARLVGAILRRLYIVVRTLLAPVAHAIGRMLSALGRGLVWAAQFVGRAVDAVGAVMARMWRAAYGPELMRGIGRLLVAAGRGVEWVGRHVGRAALLLCRGIGRGLAAAGRALLVVGRSIGRGLAAAWRGVAWMARYVGRGLRAAAVGVDRVWRAVYGPEMVQVAGGLLAAAASAADRFLRWLWQGLTAPFRLLRRVLRPMSAAVGDLRRRCAESLRRQWKALRGSF